MKDMKLLGRKHRMTEHASQSVGGSRATTSAETLR